MAQIFTGTFRRSLDGKNRIMVPSEVRDALSPDDRSGLFLIPSKACVFLWPKSYLLRYAGEKGSDPIGNLAFNRSFFSRAIFKSFDGAGRIVLPGELAGRFPQGELLIAGAGLYLEAWEPARWAAQVPELDLD
ncbi:MAG: division/cell wall cluster transcriptional repressor MraZ [Planctomycetota bacterium]